MLGAPEGEMRTPRQDPAPVCALSGQDGCGRGERSWCTEPACGTGGGRKATRLGFGPAPAPSRARRCGQAAKASPGRSRAKQGMVAHGAAMPTGRSPGRAETPLGLSPAPLRLRGRRPRRRADAERRRGLMGGPSLFKVRVGPGADSCGARPRCSLRGRRRARLQGRCKAEAERRRGGFQPLPAGRSPGRIGSPLPWGPAQVQPTRPKAHNAVRASPEARREGGCSLSPSGRSPGRAGGPLGWGLAQIQSAWLKAR